jgi:hypothetical protein
MTDSVNLFFLLILNDKVYFLLPLKNKKLSCKICCQLILIEKKKAQVQTNKIEINLVKRNYFSIEQDQKSFFKRVKESEIRFSPRCYHDKDKESHFVPNKVIHLDFINK